MNEQQILKILFYWAFDFSSSSGKNKYYGYKKLYIAH